MSDTTLRDLVLKRLDADTRPEDEWSALVLAALEGPDELAQLLDEQAPEAPKPPSLRAPSAETGGEGPAVAGKPSGTPPGEPPGKPPAEPASPRIAFLRTITVEGFRGIGPKATLDLTPGPGLTLVVGRNGSGKSSFAEALELLLTGETYRWENRSKVWKDGWRNLHHPKARVAAEFALEGEKGTCTVAREWQDGPDLEAATTWAQVHGKPRTGQGGARLGHPARRLPPLPLLQRARLACSTRARRSSTTPSRRSSASTPSWTRRPPSSRPAPRATRRRRTRTRTARPSSRSSKARPTSARREGQGGARKEGLGPRRPRSRPRRLPDDPRARTARPTSSSACPSSSPPTPRRSRRPRKP